MLDCDNFVEKEHGAVHTGQPITRLNEPIQFVAAPFFDPFSAIALSPSLDAACTFSELPDDPPGLGLRSLVLRAYNQPTELLHKDAFYALASVLGWLNFTASAQCIRQKVGVESAPVFPSPQPQPSRPYTPPVASVPSSTPFNDMATYNVNSLNEYRARLGIGAVTLDPTISAFAMEGSRQLINDHSPHAHFLSKAKGSSGLAPGFRTAAGENQGDRNGFPQLDSNPDKNGQKQIDTMLKMMFDEGPSGSHYQNMMNGNFHRIGVAIIDVDGRMYLTNDFSD